MKLLGNRVLIMALPQPKKTAGGIHLCPTYQDDRMQHLVLAVGPGLRNRKGVLLAPEVKCGDRILVALYKDHATLANGQRVIDAAQILAIIEG